MGFLLSEHDRSYLWNMLLFQGKILTAYEDVKKYTCMYLLFLVAHGAERSSQRGHYRVIWRSNKQIYVLSNIQ